MKNSNNIKLTAMENELKKYEKPSVEVMDIQWSECIAASPVTEGLRIKLNSGDNLHTFVWGELSGASWD